MKKIIRILAFIIALNLLASCTNQRDIVNGGEIEVPTRSNNKKLTKPEYPNKPGDYFERYTDEYEKFVEEHPFPNQIKDSLIAFTDDTAKMLIEDGENLIYSPLSLYYALGMLSYGASGETELELKKYMHFDGENIEDDLKNLYLNESEENDYTTVKIANSIWINNNCTDIELNDINQDYLKTMENNFFADIYNVDYSDIKTIEEMNDWVDKATFSKIPNPIQEIDKDSVMSLMNTIYYKSEFKEKFNIKLNIQDEFISSGGNAYMTEFMNKSDHHMPIKRDDDYISTSIKLKGGEMHFILPIEGLLPENLLNKGKFIKSYFEKEIEYKNTDFYTPKIGLKQNHDLLEKLHLDEILGKNSNTNLSGIIDSELFVSDIRQDNVFDMDEKGVQAASFTIADIDKTAAMPEQDEKIEIKLNRPFIFLLTLDNGEIAFVGLVNNIE
ncbi:MAG: serpin family protein [Tissierellia bacterium]|nr:serpin family protein [Tissierellia bacterium]